MPIRGKSLLKTWPLRWESGATMTSAGDADDAYALSPGRIPTQLRADWSRSKADLEPDPCSAPEE